MLKIIQSLIPQSRNKTVEHPVTGVIYAVVTGTYCGEMWACIGSMEKEHKFLSVPKNINRIIPKDKFAFGLKHNIIEVIEELPQDVFNVIQAQYHYNENINHRHEQPSSSNILDSEECLDEAGD